MTGQSIEEAKEAALDELGVDEQDADIEVLADVKMGLFGRVRNPARVRARIRPTTPRAKEDRRDRRRRNRTAAGSEASSGGARSRNGGRSGGGRDKTPAGEAVGSGGSAGSGRVGTKEPASAPAPAASDESGSPAEEAEARASGSGSSSKRRSRHRSKSSRPSQAGRASSETAAEASSAPVDTPTNDAAAPPVAAAERPSGSRRARPSPAQPLERHADLDDNEDLREGADMEVALDEQAGVATEFLSGLVDRFGLQATLEVQQPDDETLSIELTGDNLGLLIGPKGATLLAIQDLTRTVVQRRTGAGNGRIYVDVSGYRRQRSEALARFAAKVASDVQARGQRIALEPMSAPDRKVVHDALTDVPGIHTVSEGEEPHRRVVVVPDEA